jgi:hypothetical protein
VLVAFPGDLVDVVLYRFARTHGRFSHSRCNVSLSVRSSLATLSSCDILEAVESVESVSCISWRSVVGNLFSGPLSSWFGSWFDGSALDRKCRQRRDGTRDGCAEDILKVSQHKIHLNLDRISLAAGAIEEL